MITITESTEVFQSTEGQSTCDGQEMLTCTVWADDEAIQSFGGCLYETHEDVRAKAAACANKWSDLKGSDIKSYDAFIREMDRKSWIA